MFGHLSKQAGIPCNQKHLKDLDALSLIPIFRCTIAGIQGYSMDLWWIFHLCQENGISRGKDKKVHIEIFLLIIRLSVE